MNLTETINTACAYTANDYQPAAWLHFIDTLVTENQLEYSSNDEGDAWINVMNSDGNQVFFCGRNFPLIFIGDEYTPGGLDQYEKKEVVLVKDWWSAEYAIELKELKGCVNWHATEIDPAELFSLLDLVYATH
ncbi:hypothetical protein [uncultured Chitinophaga sp.]|uniref:hypothetical protein n=1 Tax=uncultured Chitinophaga sp. TaxID=339340 RepID=UPI0025D1C021|nr:hypothetical protein [uncultured Chitinophaga sp.]